MSEAHARLGLITLTLPRLTRFINFPALSQITPPPNQSLGTHALARTYIQLQPVHINASTIVFFYTLDQGSEEVRIS